LPGRVSRKCSAGRLRIARRAAVDLVHEYERRNAQASQRPHQYAGLRLDALHGRDDQHGAVEHAQHAFHLGDEIRVAGSVDQVDRDVVDDERHDGGLDRDAALAFQRHRIGLGAAVIDAADLADDTGGIQQPLGQRCLTGVYMRQDSQVQRSHCASCPLNRWPKPGVRTWTLDAFPSPDAIGCRWQCSRRPRRDATEFVGAADYSRGRVDASN
jgi:hypothetical protein